MKHAMGVSPTDVLGVLVDVLGELKGAREVFLLVACRHMIATYPADRVQLAEALRRVMPEREKEMLSIAAQEWMAEGKAEGKAEGEAEGEARGEAKALLRVLERRFGPLSAEARDRVAAADVVQVEAWLDRAVDAPTVDEALASPVAH